MMGSVSKRKPGAPSEAPVSVPRGVMTLFLLRPPVSQLRVAKLLCDYLLHRRIVDQDTLPLVALDLVFQRLGRLFLLFDLLRGHDHPLLPDVGMGSGGNSCVPLQSRGAQG